ncbi:uncharacterized protein [Amphiura filiformis]|uniref:uncharacterized protein n=1 Tax=Amphiura filiformis TaxID=82378 RepID=UPI003B21AACA
MANNNSLLFCYIVCICFVCGQIPIPNRPLGFPYAPASQSLVQLDAFLDLTCPYSKASFPVLKEVADHYGSTNLGLNVLIFPLPYHRSAWLAAQSTYIVNGMDSWIKWMADFFDDQDKFTTDATVDKSDSEIMKMIADVAGKVVERLTFLSKLLEDEGDSDARIMWKYSCSRTVSGTPQFLVNGVSVAASSSWTFDDWKSIIDPLLGKRFITKSLIGPNCANGTKSCMYLPGKYECCTAGESCTPNVGCRC